MGEVTTSRDTSNMTTATSFGQHFNNSEDIGDRPAPLRSEWTGQPFLSDAILIERARCPLDITILRAGRMIQEASPPVGLAGVVDMNTIVY